MLKDSFVLIDLFMLLHAVDQSCWNGGSGPLNHNIVSVLLNRTSALDVTSA
jgi:hypothetical protein